jgi:hypothetical protein
VGKPLLFASNAGYREAMQLESWAQRLLFELGSFVVAAFPEHAKQEERFQPYATPRMHVFSGAVEATVAAVLFIVAMIRYVVGFANNQGYTAIASMPTTDYGTFFGVGVLAYLSFFITPPALLLVFCVAEGLVRTYETALTGRLLGMTLVTLPWWLAERLHGQAQRARTAALLGPSRPDEVVLPGESRVGLLEIFSVEDKPWSDVQVVEYQGTFYILTGKRLVPRGRHHAYRYRLQPTEDREVIRGSIVRYEPPAQGGEAPGPAAPSPGAGVSEGACVPKAQAPGFTPPDPETFAAARKAPAEPAPGGRGPRGQETSKS